MIMSNSDATYLDCGYAGWVTDGNNWCSPYKGWQVRHPAKQDKVFPATFVVCLSPNAIFKCSMPTYTFLTVFLSVGVPTLCNACTAHARLEGGQREGPREGRKGPREGRKGPREG